MNGVSADGVGVKFPIFAVNCSRFPLSSRRITEKRRKTKTKRKRKRRKKKKKKGNFSEPIESQGILAIVTPDIPKSEIAATFFVDSGGSLGEELGEILGGILDEIY